MNLIDEKIMAVDYLIDKHSKNKKKALFKMFIYVVIEIICLNWYIVVSGVTGNFDWTVELLTTTGEGIFIQIITLAALIVGILFFVQFMIYIALILTAPEDSD